MQAYKRIYDRRSYEPMIRIGSRVYCHSKKIKVGTSRAFHRSWVGPLRVIAISQSAVNVVPISKPNA